MTTQHKNYQTGMTLIELMIVVAIIAILAAVGYPSYRDSVQRSNRTEAKTALINAGALQERFFSDNNTYTLDMTALGLAADPFITENTFYSIDVLAATAACPLATCYVMTASNQNGQEDDDDCETISLDSLGQKTAADSGGGVATNCW